MFSLEIKFSGFFPIFIYFILVRGVQRLSGDFRAKLAREGVCRRGSMSTLEKLKILTENEITELCKGVHCVDLGESFQTHIFLQNLASIQPRTSPVKFARPTQPVVQVGPSATGDALQGPLWESRHPAPAAMKKDGAVF